MAKLFSAKEICEFALQEVVEFSVHEMGADADALRRTLDRFDLLAAHVFATEEPIWIQEESAEIDIPANTVPWDFVASAGTGIIAANRFQLAKEASLRETSTGRYTPIDLISRQQWEGIDNKATTGRPDRLFIDRQEFNPLAYLSPMVAVTGYKLRLSWYATSKTLTFTSGHDVPTFAQRWMVLKLARDIGSGPVVRLEMSFLTDLDNRIKLARDELDHAIRQTRTVKTVNPRSVC